MSETRAEWLARMRSVGVISKRTRDTVVDGRRPNGERCKSTTDDLGNTVTESSNRQDVHIKAPTVELKLSRGDSQ